jgi:hypothetical protein
VTEIDLGLLGAATGAFAVIIAGSRALIRLIVPSDEPAETVSLSEYERIRAELETTREMHMAVYETTRRMLDAAAEGLQR